MVRPVGTRSLFIRNRVNMPVSVRANRDMASGCVRMTVVSALLSGQQMPPSMSERDQQDIATQDCPAEDWG